MLTRINTYVLYYQAFDQKIALHGMARISNVLDQGNQKEWKDEMNWSLNYMKDILYSVQEVKII